MSFLKKYLPKHDPLARIFRPDPTPYKIDLYYVGSPTFRYMKVSTGRKD